MDRPPVHELSAVNGHSLRFKYRATAVVHVDKDVHQFAAPPRCAVKRSTNRIWRRGLPFGRQGPTEQQNDAGLRGKRRSWKEVRRLVGVRALRKARFSQI
jgi:hypothetical protein